jgi:hypothetical protein
VRRRRPWATFRHPADGRRVVVEKPDLVPTPAQLRRLHSLGLLSLRSRPVRRRLRRIDAARAIAVELFRRERLEP